jgi:uncharacterized protein YecE (DUF72 family)
MPKRPRLQPIAHPTLFEMDKPEPPSAPSIPLSPQRPYIARGLLLGTSSFTADGWQTSFYPPGTPSRNFLRYYVTQFNTVEIDSTYYGTPSAQTVTNWFQRTPPDFIFAAKVPQAITHQKLLLNCEVELGEFLERMNLLSHKLGPLLLQFPWFNKNEMQADEFCRRLRSFLDLAKASPPVRFAVEIRNKSWLDQRFLDLLREFNVALALTDHSYMPRPWEISASLDLVTSDFVYVRWLGDRKGIEALTTTWDKTIVDRAPDLKNWAALFRQLVSRNLKVYAYANNHYSGYGPGTVKLFWDFYQKR